MASSVRLSPSASAAYRSVGECWVVMRQLFMNRRRTNKTGLDFVRWTVGQLTSSCIRKQLYGSLACGPRTSSTDIFPDVSKTPPLTK